MKHFLYIIFALLMLGGTAKSTFAGEAPLTLASQGSTKYVIALASGAIPAETTAAQQLQFYLHAVTGADFIIKDEKDVPDNVPQILVGSGTRVKVLLPAQHWNNLGPDGIILKTAGNKLILAGGRPRGTLYAVYQFLENTVGCRWWTPTEKDIPHIANLTIPPQDITYVPPFKYREVFTNSTAANVNAAHLAAHPEFATTLKQYGYFTGQDESWGGHYIFAGGGAGFVHTSTNLLPPEKYFHEHPEWFSDPTNGGKPCTAASPMPSHYGTQICFTNKAAQQEAAKNALQYIADNPAGQLIDVSQADGFNYCRSAACEQLAKTEGSESGPLLEFVNAIANQINRAHPGYPVSTLAYAWTLKPPKTLKPAPNVIVRFAPINADFGHPFNSDWNKQYLDDFWGWKKIAPKMYIWNYVTNFKCQMLPHPNWGNLGKDIRFYADNGAKGFFEQGDTVTDGVGDFVQLRTWILGHLLWNPQLDENALTHEFLQGYYGAAAPYLQQYLQLIQRSFLESNSILILDNNDFSFLNLDTMNQATRLFTKAKTAVQNQKVLLSRVEREELSLQTAWIKQYPILRQIARLQNKPFDGPADPQKAAKDIAQHALQYAKQNFPDAASYPDYMKKWLTPMLRHNQTLLPALSSEVPASLQNLPRASIIDFQQNQFNLTKSGTLTQITGDPQASDGKAVQIAGNSKEWAVTVRWKDYGSLLRPGKWHCLAMVRVEPKPGATLSGNALALGVYDAYHKRGIYWSLRPLAKLGDNRYHLLDSGPLDLDAGAYFFVAPTNNPAVQHIYVDRLLLVKD